MSTAGGGGGGLSVPDAGDVFRPYGEDVTQPSDKHDSKPGPIINAIERAKPGDPLRFHADQLPPLALPGFGEEYDDCGEDVPRFCEHCGHVSIWGRTCYRSVCPRCSMSWVRRRATAICSKLEAYRRYAYASSPPGTNQFFHHVVISPPKDWAVAAEDPLERTLDVIKEILVELDLEGVIFYHPFRGKGDDDRGFWKTLVGQDREWEGDAADEVKLSPHFHVVGVSPHVAGAGVTDVVSDETDWFIKRLTKGEDSKVSIYDLKDLARVVTYCLSHTGLYQTKEQTRAAYRHVGADYIEHSDPELASGDLEAEVDAIVRAVAPITLGLPYNSLACSDERVDVKTAIQVDSPGIPSQDGDSWKPPPDDLNSASSSSTSSSGTSSPTGDSTVVEPERCAGRVLNIMKAPRYLKDDEWVEQAPHADDTREAYIEYTDRPPDD